MKNNKTLNDGRLTEHIEQSPPSSCTLTMSARSELDGAMADGMGTACTRPAERVFAALGLSNGAPVHFERCLDVPFGGVLCAVPGLISNGLLQALRRDIGPRLLEEVPGQPTDQQLADNPRLCRFVIVFDREGYSPAFFKEMWVKYRIACITYRKNCRDTWPLEWFEQVLAEMPRGETVVMQLAEQGTLLGSGDNAVWVKEVRKLTESGHQTAIVSTAYGLESTAIAPHMFTRWCQENFFAYAMHLFPIDILTEHGKEPFSGTEKVVNPIWRETERQRNSAKGKLDRRRVKFVAMDPEAAAAHNHPRHTASPCAICLYQPVPVPPDPDLRF